RWMSRRSRRVLKSLRETALVLLGVPVIIATSLAWMLLLLRNSNEGTGIGDYELDLSGGRLLVWQISNRSHQLRLDTPDLILLVAATSICLLAWVIFMRWR